MIGLVLVALSLLVRVSGDNTTLATIIDFTSTVVTILLAFGLLRKFAATHSRAQGFSYGRGVGFVVVMMMVAGVLSGIYSSVMATFFIREELLASVDTIMVDMQDMIPAESFDSTYQLMRSSVVNPLLLTISAVISNAFWGLIMGLCLAVPTRRQPDIFAPEEGSNENQEQQ